MILKPNSKINLGLNVVRKRGDGYHDLETVFYPLDLCDTLEVSPAVENRLTFSSRGIKIPGDQSSNLCIQAYKLMHEHFGIPPVKIELEKKIPMGSGLGGGSSDGAYTLIALNEMFQLKLNVGQLKAFASRIGSDCAFFIANTPSFARGRGEILEAVNVDLRGYYFVVVVPPVHASTMEAYAVISPKRPSVSLQDIIRRPVSEWKGLMVNDFEEPVGRKIPAVPGIRNLLYQSGAVYASMSGSGSSVFGLFDRIPAVEGLFPGCFIWVSEKIS